VSTEQRENLDAILRQSAFPAGSDVSEQRRQLRELLSAQPLPADVTVTAAALGGVPAAEITIDGIEPRHVVLYFHGGVYVLGDAFLAAGLASQVGRRTRATVISVDYRLAPEHPYPAAVDDALAAYEALLRGGTAPPDIAFAGESAGGGLAVATLVNARDHGPPPSAAAFVMSPYADLTLAGTTMDTKRQADPLLSRENLQPRVTDYTAGHDAALGLISPIFADLSGLPPLIIQAGTHEVLLDDAVRLARQAATADVQVTLDITPGCRTSSRPITRSSTKRPRRWTEPDSSCPRISPAQNASPHSDRQNARDDGPKPRSTGRWLTLPVAHFVLSARIGRDWLAAHWSCGVSLSSGQQFAGFCVQCDVRGGQPCECHLGPECSPGALRYLLPVC
jgi:epsilon-lactone hydrolase